MPNTKHAIDSHNKKLLTYTNTASTTETRTCNCRIRTDCPLNGNCLTKNIIYQTTVTRQDDNSHETYIGLCATDFKTRFRNHKSSFTHQYKQNQTELSKYIWNLKNNNINYKIEWKIMQKSQPYSNTTKRCNLCLTEKYITTYKPKESSLNKRSEIASSCRHSRSYLLSQ